MITRLHQTLVVFFILSLTVLTRAASAACYYPNGDLAQNHTPCNDDGEESWCCGQGYACLSNKICQATGEELQRDDAAKFVRGSCTDKDWRSSSCPSFCMDDDDDDVDGDEGMGKCEGTSKDLYWCINEVEDSVNCTSGENLLYFPGTPTVITTIGISPTASSKSTSSTSHKTTTTTEEPSKLSLPEPEDSSHSSSDSEAHTDIKGPIIAAVISSVVIFLLIAFIGVFLCFRSRSRSRAAKLKAKAPIAKDTRDEDHVLESVSPETRPPIAPLSTWYPEPLRLGTPFEASTLSLLEDLPANNRPAS